MAAALLFPLGNEFPAAGVEVEVEESGRGGVDRR